MLFLPLVPLITAIISMCVITATSDCNEFECADIVQYSLDCDVCWCYEEGGFGCFCCTACHDTSDPYAK
jgi:hypothetical protein